MSFRFTKVEKNAMITMLNMGMTVRQTADNLGLKYDQVYAFKYNNVMHEAERTSDALPTGHNTPAADNNRRFAFRFTDAEKNAMITMLADGLTARQTAERLGFNIHQVKNFKRRQKMRDAKLAAKRAMEEQPAPATSEAEPAVVMAEAKPVAAADSGNIVQIDLPLAQGERIVRVPIKLKLDISVA